MREVGDLLHEASLHPVVGWDFSWLGNRITWSEPAWDFDAMVVELAHRSANLLDLGTGGGEWLSSLAHRPVDCVATESWPTNVTVAAKRLAPLGVKVVGVDPAPDNASHDAAPLDYRGLPFGDSSFHLICSRHESFVATEVARLLDRGGRFITEQVGDGHYSAFHELLGLAESPTAPLTLDMIVAQLERAALVIKASQGSTGTVQFADVGALAWYLRMVPWIVPGFTVTDFGARLSALHERIASSGPLSVRLDTFYVIAKRPKKSK